MVISTSRAAATPLAVCRRSGHGQGQRFAVDRRTDRTAASAARRHAWPFGRGRGRSLQPAPAAGGGAGDRAVLAHLQGARAHARRPAACRRGLRHAGGDPLGRSRRRRRAGLRSGQSHGRRPGKAVRLQQRLSRPLCAAGRQPQRRPLPAGRQPRVRQLQPDVRRSRQRARHQPQDIEGPGRRRDGGPRRRRDRDRAPGRRLEGGGGQQVRAPHHRQHADRHFRAGRRARAAQDVGRSGGPQGAGHLRQLRRRRHAVGHLAHLRGEFRRLLRRRGREAAAAGDAQALRHRPRRRLRLVAPRRSLRPRQGAQRGQPLRLGGRDRSLRARRAAGEAHRAGPLQARGLHLRRSPRTAGSSSTAATTSASSMSTSSSPPGRGTPTTAPPTRTCWTRARSTSRASMPTARSSGCRWCRARAR